jgi:uncharacterized protein YaiI (UPF0178 family)
MMRSMAGLPQRPICRTVASVKILVDADACPAAVKEIVIRAAERLAVSAVFVANKAIRLPPSRQVSTVRVGMGLDVADGYIARAARPGDLAITADIPLAAALVAGGVVVLDLRGTVYTEENVGEALALRNFHQELREGGLAVGGPGGFGPRQAREFAAAFDRELQKALRRPPGAKPT